MHTVTHAHFFYHPFYPDVTNIRKDTRLSSHLSVLGSCVRVDGLSFGEFSDNRLSTVQETCCTRNMLYKT